MKNRILLVLLAIVLVVSLAAFGACAAPVEEEEEKAPPVEEKAPPKEEKAAPPKEEKKAPPVVEEVWEWPEKLPVLSQSAGSLAYAIYIGWTTPLEKDTGTKIRLVCEDVAMTRWLWMKQKRFFTAGLSTEPDDWLEANLELATRDAGPYQMRTWWPVGKGGMGYAVRGDSPIKTPRDIKPGMKIIYLAFSPIGKVVMYPLLAWAQVDPEDVEWIPAGTIEANTRFVMEGRGDVAVAWPMSSIWYEAEAGPQGLGWIEMNAKEDPEGAQRYLELRPGTRFGVIDFGVPSAHGVWMCPTLPRYQVHADADEELVYHMVKWMDENYDKYKDAHTYCAFMTLDTLMQIAESDYVPLHRGAVKYLEEKGLWTPAHEARRQQQIDLLTRHIEAYETAIDIADEKGIEVDPKNEKWLELWDAYKKELGLPKFGFFVGLD